MGVGPNPIHIDNKLYRDPPHESSWVSMQINRTSAVPMSGFVRAYEAAYKKRKSDPSSRARHVMGYYTRATLPVLYRLADEFAVCDQWFSSFPGSTWPNRAYLLAGDCGDLLGTGFKWLPRWNAFQYPDPPFAASWTGMMNHWKAYSARPEQDSTLALWRIGPVYRGPRGGSLDDFANDCQQEKLPRLGIIEPDYGVSDDHPPHEPLRGQQFLARVVKALLSSRSWERSLLIVVYDEHGGFYDHVLPPASPESRPAPHDFLGVRVPAIVASPYTPTAQAVHTQLDHTTVLKTIAERWGYAVPGPRGSSPAMSSLWNTPCFDFTQPPRNGTEILRRIPEPGFTVDSPDILRTLQGRPTGLQDDLRVLNTLREMERLL
jgi:phospholipase C